MALWESSCNYWASSSSLVWQHLRCWYSAMDHKKISALLWAIRIVIGRPIYNVYCQRIGLELLIIYILLCRLSNLLVLSACTCEKHKWLVTCAKNNVDMSACQCEVYLWIFDVVFEDILHRVYHIHNSIFILHFFCQLLSDVWWHSFVRHHFVLSQFNVT